MPKMTFSPAYKEFIKKLTTARLEVNLSQRGVSAQLKKDKTYVRSCETLQRRVDFIELLEFCRVYGKPVEFFVVDLGLNEKK